MPSRIRLIASDLDGTLLSPDRILPDETVTAIHDALAAGIHFCLASGRSISTMFRFAHQIGIPGPIVSCNGAFVTGLGGELVKQSCLSPEAVKSLIRFASDRNLHTNTYCGADVYFSTEGPEAQLYRERTQLHDAKFAPLNGMAAMSPNKILFIDQPAANERHHLQLNELAASTGFTIVRSEPDYIEFLPSGITKGAGLAILCEQLGIQPSEVAAIGDWLNDYEMLEWAGRSAAVANAHADVLALADTVVPSNAENGAAHYIRSVLEDAKADILSG